MRQSCAFDDWGFRAMRGICRDDDSPRSATDRIFSESEARRRTSDRCEDGRRRDVAWHSVTQQRSSEFRVRKKVEGLAGGQSAAARDDV